MTRSFDLGKIAHSSEKKMDTVEVTVSLTEKENGVAIFKANAKVYDNKGKVILEGQCFDALNEEGTLRNNATFALIYDMWQKYQYNHKIPEYDLEIIETLILGEERDDKIQELDFEIAD